MQNRRAIEAGHPDVLEATSIGQPGLHIDSNPCLNRDQAFARHLATLQAVQPEKGYGTQASTRSDKSGEIPQDTVLKRDELDNLVTRWRCRGEFRRP